MENAQQTHLINITPKAAEKVMEFMSKRTKAIYTCVFMFQEEDVQDSPTVWGLRKRLTRMTLSLMKMAYKS